MAKMNKTVALIIVAVAALALIGSIAGTYNKLVTLNEGVDGQWAQVETVYQRRFDLVPNLVNATKGFLEQERAIYDAITEARTQYADAGSARGQVAAVNNLESALARLLVVVESNPEIKSNTTVAALMSELSGTENRISVERRRFNESVQGYNVTVKRFPTNLWAAMMGFGARDFFESNDGAADAPEVDLSL